MSKEIKLLSIFCVSLIIILMLSTTIIQFFRADEYAKNDWNMRSTYKEFGVERGSILVQNGNSLKEVAKSVPVDDAYKFQRVYSDTNYSPVTGYFSIINKSDRGIEYALDDELSGNIDELAITNLVDLATGKTTRGADVVLTLDDKLQAAAMQGLKDSGFKGAVVAVEPSTGKILSLASYPNADYSNFASHNAATASEAYTQTVNDSDAPMINRATDSLLPPGSTFKIMTTTAALETGEYTPDTSVESPLTYILPNTATYLPNYAGGNCSASNGVETLSRALQMSCNTTFAILGNKLGSTKMKKQADQFAIGDALSIADGQKGGSFSVVKSVFPENAAPDRLAMDAIGQAEVKITPLQDCLLSAAVANNGKIMKPYLVDRIQQQDATILRKTSPTVLKTAMSEKSSQYLRDMMSKVVSQGTASSARISGVQVAGKTGTAENASDMLPHSWFTGFAPSDSDTSAKIAISVVLENAANNSNPATVLAQKLLKTYLTEHA